MVHNLCSDESDFDSDLYEEEPGKCKGSGEDQKANALFALLSSKGKKKRISSSSISHSSSSSSSASGVDSSSSTSLMKNSLSVFEKENAKKSKRRWVEFYLDPVYNSQPLVTENCFQLLFLVREYCVTVQKSKL